MRHVPADRDEPGVRTLVEGFFDRFRAQHPRPRHGRPGPERVERFRLRRVCDDGRQPECQQQGAERRIHVLRQGGVCIDVAGQYRNIAEIDDDAVVTLAAGFDGGNDSAIDNDVGIVQVPGADAVIDPCRTQDSAAVGRWLQR